MELLDFTAGSSIALAYTVVKWLLMALLLTSSAIWNHTRFAIPLVLGLVLMCVGMLFKMLHWPFAIVLMLVGAVVTATSYVLWYRAKAQRVLLDYLKLAWVLSACATVVAAALFHQMVRPLNGSAEALFWAMALLLVYQRWIRRPGASE